MHPTLTPNSCLLAVLLIVRSTAGVNFVFHYPPRPHPDRPAATSYRSSAPTEAGSSSSSSSGSSSDSDASEDRQSRATWQDNATGRTPTEASDSESRSRNILGGHGSGRRSRRRNRGSAGDDERVRKGRQPWEKVLGFETEFLGHMLAPKAVMCKQKFELSIDDMVFLGFPLHVRPDGTWRKKKRKKVERRESSRTEGMGEGRELAPEKEDAGKEGEDADDEREEDEETDGTERERHEGSMSMFHVVFVLNPPELEYHARVQTMFDYVVRRFTRALKYEQAKDGYVWRESENIRHMKEHASEQGVTYSELWHVIIDSSSLAFAISRVFADISTSRIAHVILNNSIGLSLQIPRVSEISTLPTPLDPQMPGLPLTTANSFGDDENEGDTLLAKHFTLLFLEDVSTILKDLSSSSAPTETTASLVAFVKSCTPTQSFLQISNTTGIPLHEIQFLARHLIHWRKARAIPPIHQRDTFIVSPNGDLKRIPHLCGVFARSFPTMPALPKFLAMLSGKPKPFASFIPWKNHREAYLEILEWLIRYGLVVQLRTFAHLKVTKAVKERVYVTRMGAYSPMSPKGAHSPSSSAMVAGIPEFEDSFITTPHQASGEESQWIEEMTRTQPPDVKALFDRCLKYLNGQHAIEKIAVREGIARREVRRVLGALEEYLVYERHW